MYIKHNTLFFLRKSVGADTAPLRCKVRWNAMEYTFSVGYTVNVKDWVADAQRCKPRSIHGKKKIPANVINEALDAVFNIVESIFINFATNNTIPDVDDFKSYLSSLRTDTTNKTNTNNFFDAFDEFIKENMTTGRWRENTLKRIITAKNHLYKMNPRLTFDTLRMEDLIIYMSTQKNKDGEVGLSNTTSKKLINIVKWFLRWCQEKKIRINNAEDFVNQKSRLTTTSRPVIYLTWEELMSLYNFDFSAKPYLARVRDVFCFCCFSSLRWSDVDNLKKSDIYDDAIHITTIKTADTLTIELNQYTSAILQRYADTDSERALPVITNQKMNKYLKEVGELCQLIEPITITSYVGSKRVDKTYRKWELLTTHAGRRTFICNALMLGIAPNIVMRWTGHSDYAAMKPYIAIADEVKKSAMNLFNNIGTKSGNKISSL
jgi:integrase